MSAEYKQPLFSAEEFAENKSRKAELIKACASQESVLVVGAGMSNRLGYPTWGELLDHLHELVATLGKEHNRPFSKPPDWTTNPLSYADSLRSHVQACTNNLDRYHSFLRRTFDFKGADTLHRQLVALPFRGIVTTNYDPSLDHALAVNEPSRAVDNHFVVDRDHAHDVSDFVASLRHRGFRRRQIAHLHGRFNSPHSIVLTESDYRKQYNRSFDSGQRRELFDLIQSQGLDAVIDHVESNLPEWTLHRKFLWALFSTRSAIFVGFSMEDPYFTYMLNTVVNDLWRWDQPSHFAVMPLSEGDALAKEKARRLRSQYGVAVVFYENPDGRHGELDSLVQEMCSACDVRGVQRTAPDVEDGQPIKTSGMSGWMARINDRTRRRAAQ